MRAVGLLVAGTIITTSPAAYSPNGNVRVFKTEDGKAVLEWVSPATFRFCRDWSGKECSEEPLNQEEVDFKEEAREGLLAFETEHLRLEVEARTLRLRVLSREGKPILEEAGKIERAAGTILAKRTAQAEERFFGLGFRAGGPMDCRGRKVSAEKPFLISSLGYGLYHSSPGEVDFDFSATDAKTYQTAVCGADRFEYYLHYGPTPKEILEEHAMVVAAPSGIRPWHFAILHERRLPERASKLPEVMEPSWESLRRTVVALVNGSLSAELLPAMDIEPYREAPLAIYRRAMELARVVPLVHSKFHLVDDEQRLELHHEMAQARKRLNPFLMSYGRDVEGRGHPIARALPLQFPRDAAAAQAEDEFMLGDELLVAPLLGPEARRSVYLPMGLWTDLRTNVRFTGRRRVDLEASEAGPILMVKSGSILPLAPLGEGEPMELHYFPKLAAEFFLFEPDRDDYTQVHAGPAGEQLRLEIESKASRTYEWVVHHLRSVHEVRSDGAISPSAAATGLKVGAWSHDPSSGTLRLRVAVPAQNRNVAFISFNQGAFLE